MAEKDFTTVSEEAVQEGQLGGGYPLCEECGELCLPGEKLCSECNRGQEQEVARQELIEENTLTENLIDLLHQTTISLNSFCKLIDSADDEYQKIWAVLQPLLERQWADLEKIEAVIAGTLGKIQVLVCTDPMSVGGKSYGVEDFYQATLTPKEAKGGAGQLQ